MIYGRGHVWFELVPLSNGVANVLQLIRVQLPAVDSREMRKKGKKKKKVEEKETHNPAHISMYVALVTPKRTACIRVAKLPYTLKGSRRKSAWLAGRSRLFSFFKRDSSRLAFWQNACPQGTTLGRTMVSWQTMHSVSRAIFLRNAIAVSATQAIGRISMSTAAWTACSRCPCWVRADGRGDIGLWVEVGESGRLSGHSKELGSYVLK